MLNVIILSLFYVFLFERHILEARLVTAVSLHPQDYIPIKECFWATVENVSFLFCSDKFLCLLYTGCFKVLAGSLSRERIRVEAPSPPVFVNYL